MKGFTERAMLVKFSVSQWTARKTDKKAEEYVREQFGSAAAMGWWNKCLVAQEPIKRISKVVNEARTYHYQNTLPWTDEGFRVLTVLNFDKYSEKMREYRSQIETQVEIFCKDFPNLVEEARVKLGKLFNPLDYPLNVRNKFKFSVDIRPIPDASDFRVMLADEHVNKIKNEIGSRMFDAAEEAHKDLYKRLAMTVGHMAEKLKDSEGIFRDSLVENLRELCELIPLLNIAEDEELEKIRRKAEEKLCQVEPWELRENQITRKQVATDASKILKEMEGLYA